MAKTVLIPLAEGFEELEAVTLMDIMVRAGADVIRAGLGSLQIKASRGTVIVADMLLDDALAQDFDLIALPGGLPGADHLKNYQPLLDRLKRQVDDNKPVAAICAAPRVLSQAGLIHHHKVTCYPGALADMDNAGTEITIDAVVKSGLIHTSRGPGTALDFSLALVEELFGEGKRRTVEEALVR